MVAFRTLQRIVTKGRKDSCPPLVKASIEVML
jgi:hypothetical protein